MCLQSAHSTAGHGFLNSPFSPIFLQMLPEKYSGFQRRQARQRIKLVIPGELSQSLAVDEMDSSIGYRIGWNIGRIDQRDT